MKIRLPLTINRVSYKLCLLLWSTFFVSYNLSAQSSRPLPIQWTYLYGGSQTDIPYSIQITSDGGTVIAGYTESDNRDADPKPSDGFREYWDAWILKLDQCGKIQWKRTIGGTGYDLLRDIKQTTDGGFIAVGETNSTDGDVVKGYGGTKDIWVVKLDGTGAVQWQKRYGGTALDLGNSIHFTASGAYIITASSASNDGDIKGNHTTGTFTDGVVLKIDNNGSLLWSKCFGGSKNEELVDFEEINGNLYFAGYANSIDGDIPPSQKNYDVWLLALDATGNKIFSKVYGGAQNDVAYSMSRGKDGSLTLAGYTTSNDGAVSGAKGDQDYWIINLSTQGNLNWQKVVGGTKADFANIVLADSDGGYLVGGISYSNDTDIVDNKGKGDFFVVKLTKAGNISWVKNYGGKQTDNMRSLTYSESRNEYYLAGDSESGEVDTIRGNHGGTDYWIVKLKEPKSILKDTIVCDIKLFQPIVDTLKDICGYDSLYKIYRPVTLKGPFDKFLLADTIFSGQRIILSASSQGAIRWNTDATLSCTDCRTPVANPTETTVYTATQFLNTDSCEVSGEFTVVVLKDAVVHIPNAFSPNKDGVNEGFGPIGKVPEGYSIEIYNRLGQLVFKSNAINLRWDGTVNGKIQDTGLYIYIIQYKDIKKELQLRKGSFLLVK